MKRASWVLRAIKFAVIGCILCCLSACSTLESDAIAGSALHLTQAEFATSTPGSLTSHPPKLLSELPPLNWQPISLPHALARTITPTATGTAIRDLETVVAWYRIDVLPKDVSKELTAFYLPRWHTWGNLAVYANGILIYSSVDDGVFSSFNDPLLVRLPVELTSHGSLQLVIRMDSVRAIGGALSTVWVGPMTELRPMFEWRRTLQNRVPQITSSIFLVLGTFALGFWARRRHETTQLLFFVLSVLFYVRNLHYYVDDTSLSEDWFQWVTVNSLGWLDIVVFLFAQSFHRQNYRILSRVLIGAMIAASLLSMPIGWLNVNLPLIASFSYLVLTGVSFGVTLLLSIAAWRGRSIECAVLAAILWLNLGFGVHDWMLQNWLTDIESIYLLPIGVVALFVMFLVTELRRYLGAVSANERSSALLELRLADRERELKESYGKLHAIEQAQLLSHERQRLMREMHDGLGSALMSSLVAVERGQMQPGDIAQVLRECVDDLKLTIDSLEPVGDDLLVLLATLRYRLEPRLTAAGIRLNWDIATVPTLKWLNPTSALQILRMLQEILTNILKHARASSIRIATQTLQSEIANEVLIIVADDGVGFDVPTARGTGRGLGNLERRATDVGGRILIESSSSGSIVQIFLPIERG